MNKILQHRKKQEREERKLQGFFDGRFRSRTVPNKKKVREQKLSRSKQINTED